MTRQQAVMDLLFLLEMLLEMLEMLLRIVGADAGGGEPLAQSPVTQHPPVTHTHARMHAPHENACPGTSQKSPIRMHASTHAQCLASLTPPLA